MVVADTHGVVADIHRVAVGTRREDTDHRAGIDHRVDAATVRKVESAVVGIEVSVVAFAVAVGEEMY